MKNETTGFVEQNRAQAARRRRNPLRHEVESTRRERCSQPVSHSVRSKPNNTVVPRASRGPTKGKVREPLEIRSRRTLLYRWLPTCPLLPSPPRATEHACTHYTGVGHEEGYQNAASTDTTYVIHDSGHAVSYLASQLSTYRIDTERRVEGGTGGCAGENAGESARSTCSHKPRNISTLLRRTVRYVRIMGAYTCISPDSLVPDAADAERIACRPRNGDLRFLFKSSSRAADARMRGFALQQQQQQNRFTLLHIERIAIIDRSVTERRKREFVAVSLSLCFADSRALKEERRKRAGEK